MGRPQTRREERQGIARAELLRGAGWWPLHRYPVLLEPPLPRHLDGLSTWHLAVNGWSGPFDGRPSWQQFLLPAEAPPATVELPPARFAPEGSGHLRKVRCRLLEEDARGVSLALSAHLLTSLPGHAGCPLAFEVFGHGGLSGREAGPSLVVQFLAHASDAAAVQRQLSARFPGSAFEVSPLDGADVRPGEEVFAGEAAAFELCLAASHLFCLHGDWRLEADDPLVVAFAVLDAVPAGEWGLVQVLFARTRGAWRGVLAEALRDPYGRGLLFDDLTERDLEAKFSLPCFAVSLRLAANNPHVLHELLGFTDQLGTGEQRLEPIRQDEDDEEVRQIVGLSIRDRMAYRPGFLLNVAELASLVHLPGPTAYAENLARLAHRTRPTRDQTTQPGALAIGVNVHRGRKTVVCIDKDTFGKHVYGCGKTGQGKSTEIVNTAKALIERGEGVCVLDPHGDLIEDILDLVPRNRVEDTILFAPAEQEDCPIGLNPLRAANPRERDRVNSEAVAGVRRFSPDSWGPRLEHILRHATATAMLVKGGTLHTVKRLLTDPSYRSRVVAKLKDPDLIAFWTEEFPRAPGSAVDPVLNKLSPILMSRTLRNCLCQPVGLDFDDIMNNRKILLCNLSVGLLSEPVATMLGSFLVNKLLTCALRRAAIPREQRTSFNIFIDEFQTFLHVPMGMDRILSEARKYKLTLICMNQFVEQLTPEVRAAIFGNAGTIIAFRVGASDARILERELAGFTAEEFTNLGVGQAIVRIGARPACNVQTFPPPTPTLSYAAQIRRRARLYGMPADELEASLRHTSGATPRPSRPSRSSPAKPQTPAAEPPAPPTAPPPDGLDDFFA